MGVREEYAEEWAALLQTLGEAELLHTARDYIWLAEFGPAAGRDTFTVRRDGVVTELQHRGILEELHTIRQYLASEAQR